MDKDFNKILEEEQIEGFSGGFIHGSNPEGSKVWFEYEGRGMQLDLKYITPEQLREHIKYIKLERTNG